MNDPGVTLDVNKGDEGERAADPGVARGTGRVMGRVADAFAAWLANLHPALGGMVTAVIGYFALLAATILLGLFLIEVVLSGWVQRTDNHVNHWLAGRRTPTWTDVSLVGSGLGESVTVIASCLVVVIVMLLRHHLLAAVFLGVAITIEALVYLGTVLVIDRPRPRVIRLEDLGSGASFPSGHTAAATVTYVGIALIVVTYTRNRAARSAFVALAILGPVAVAVARVYRGMHHPLDVVSGIAMGLGCLLVGIVVARVVGRLQEQRKVQRVEEFA